MKWNLTPEKFMSESECKKLLKICTEKDAFDRLYGRTTWPRINMFIHLALMSGMRVQEIARLRVCDIHLKSDPHIFTIGKGGKERVIYISNKLKRQIKAYIRYQELTDDMYLLTSSHGKGYTTRALQKHFKSASKLAGLPEHYSIHSCRHSFATLLYHTSRDLRMVSKQLGHSNISITAVYAQSTRESILESMNSTFN